MLWYEGSIAEAVAESKRRNAVFVVFVEGGNSESTDMQAVISHEDITRRLSNQQQFLAVKLNSSSPHYTHFAQIYQFVPVPSLFFIGQNGTPLEVVCAGVQPASLVDRIDRIVQEHVKDKPPGQPMPTTSSSSLAAQSSALIESESQPKAALSARSSSSVTAASVTVTSVTDTKAQRRETEDLIADQASTSGPTAAKQAKTEYEVVCDGDVCVRRPKVSAETPASAPDVPSTEQPVRVAPPPETPSLTTEERAERAKQLIEAKRREKEAKEKEEARLKELERRSIGQGVAELKRWQAEQELKTLAEERKREKAENDLAKQRILEQIAQDRAERKARESNQAPAAPAASAPPAHTAGSPSGEGGGSAQARIQFKMADGSSHAAQFSPDSTLTELREYVASNVPGSRGEFSLWTAFPRRELSLPLQGASSLRQLGLTPSAALLVLPAGGAAGQAGPAAVPDALSRIYAFLSGLLVGLIVEPAQGIYAYIRERLFPAPPRAPRPTPVNRSPSPPRPGAPGLRYRPPTNVHRISGDRSSDDDNNTWNGNSTQQM